MPLDAGALAYIPGPTTGASAQLEMVVGDRDGKSEALKLPPGPYQNPRVSPDGKRIAFSGEDGKESPIWTFELAGTNAMQRLTFGGNNREPTWSADSKRVAFQSDRDGDAGIFWQPADGTGSAQRLTTAKPGVSHVPESWSPKNAQLLFAVTEGGSVSLWTLALKDSQGDADSRCAINDADECGAFRRTDGGWYTPPVPRPRQAAKEEEPAG